MAKHKRFFNKPKSDRLEKEIQYKNVKEIIPEEIIPEETPRDLKSIVLSGTKYAYIIAAAALLSGIFTPLTVGADLEIVVYGMLSTFLGLGGSIVIYKGITNQKFRSLMIAGGLGMMIGSLILIYEVAGRSLFG